MRYDLRAAFRHLVKSPGATALAILSIALGIGLTTGIFSVADAVLLRPIAVERPSQLLSLSSRADDGSWVGYGWLDYLDMDRAAHDLVTLVAYQRRGSMLAGPDENTMVLTVPTTANYFSILGVRAQLGTATVESVEGRPSVVIGHRLWLRRFGGDEQIVGKTIQLNGAAFRVAGVMPAEFAGLNRGVAFDIWMNMDAWFHVFKAAEEEGARNGQVDMVARLKPGVNAAHAAAVLDAAIRGAGKHKAAPAGAPGTFLHPNALGWTADLIFGGGLLLILSGVLFVACANVAQVRLAQSESRRRELGVRMALGAGAVRIARQLLVETGIVGIVGAGLGIGLAKFLMVKVTQFVTASAAFMDFGIRLDARVLAFALSALMLSVLMAGLSPVRLAIRLNVWDVISSEQGVAGTRGGWQKRALIAGQVAVSVALFGCAVLFVGSLRNAAAIHPGLDPHKKLLVMMVSPGRRTTPAEWCEPACERLAALPGVLAATYARRLPLADSGGGFMVRVEVPGRAPVSLRENNVAGNYFAVVGTRMVAGRAIDSNDREGSPPVAVVSRNFADQLLAGKEPLGQWIKVDGAARQVVGIAEDGPSNDLHEPPSPYVYLPYAQVSLGDTTLMIETVGDPVALERAARKELKQFDPEAVVFESGTLHHQIEQALSQDVMMASISTGLGVFGILLTAAGLFGVLQYSVTRRTRELGLRMAIGARPAEIQRLILGESLRMAAWGVPFGLVLLAVASWSIRSMVLGVSALDPGIYLVSASAVLAITTLAAWLPALRATRVDPMAALRSE
ncbi:MAG TPA: ADOP family duplicated permease [Bryobacteraceae bacterium]|nr:ADOP family duplicated permease [Bryobacteraceae bacterium]